MDIKFCTACGSPTHMKIPPDDDHMRAVCTGCAQIHYTNPKMVVGTLPEWEGKVLLCKRNIEPQKGKWTLPAGYLEDNESVGEGAARETREETMAEVKLITPYRMFNIVFVKQIYFMFLAQLTSENFGPTPESTEVKLFDKKDIPWDYIAFPVIWHTLDHYFKDRENNSYPFKIFDITQKQAEFYCSKARDSIIRNER
jgi:ADP-ribose pyrophosphatase YjhB (NUDIX family)